MSRKILSPYSTREYNKIVYGFQLNKINSMEKEELLNHLKNPESWIYDFYLKEKCITLFTKIGGYIPIGLVDDDLYRVGVDITISQINKRYFFDFQNDYNFFVLEKIKSRIVNNIKNYFNPKRKVSFKQISSLIYSNEDSYEIFDQIIFELDLKKLDKESLQNALRNVWEDALFDLCFDINDFENLCREFNYLPLDVLIYDPYILPQMTKETCNNGNYQLVLVFEDEETA